MSAWLALIPRARRLCGSVSATRVTTLSNVGLYCMEQRLSTLWPRSAYRIDILYKMSSSDPLYIKKPADHTYLEV